MITLSHSNKEKKKTTHIGHFYTLLILNLVSGKPKTRVNTNGTVLQAILAHFWGSLPTRLAVLLIPRMPDAYKLYLIVKVPNQR